MNIWFSRQICAVYSADDFLVPFLSRLLIFWIKEWIAINLLELVSSSPLKFSKCSKK